MFQVSDYCFFFLCTFPVSRIRKRTRTMTFGIKASRCCVIAQLISDIHSSSVVRYDATNGDYSSPSGDFTYPRVGGRSFSRQLYSRDFASTSTRY